MGFPTGMVLKEFMTQMIVLAPIAMLTRKPKYSLITAIIFFVYDLRDGMYIQQS